MKVPDVLLNQCHLIPTILLINYTHQNHVEEVSQNQHCFIMYIQIFNNFLPLNLLFVVVFICTTEVINTFIKMSNTEIEKKILTPWS